MVNTKRENIQRDYEQSHPWICFRADLAGAEHFKFWMQLGEAQSKSEHIAGVPLPDDVAKSLHRLYLAKGIVATTAIEGNTLTEEQVLQEIEGKLSLPPSKEYLRQEVQNILKACNRIGHRVMTGKGNQPLSLDLIREFNKDVLAGLTLEREVVPGEIRTHSVVVGRYRGAPAQDCEFLLERMCTWLNDFHTDHLPKIALGLVKAMLAHLYIAWIHPFGDGNGRTARLIEFFILVDAGVPSPVAHLLSNHYNETRSEYYRKLEEGRVVTGDPMPFLRYALEGFVDGLKEQLNRIRDFQWDLAWRDHVYDFFKDKDRPSDRRRLHLILDLAESKEKQVLISGLKLISPRVALDYAGATNKTLYRDIEFLDASDLAKINGDKIRAKREIVLHFLPKRKLDDFFNDSTLSLIAARVPEQPTKKKKGKYAHD